MTIITTITKTNQGEILIPPPLNFQVKDNSFNGKFFNGILPQHLEDKIFKLASTKKMPYLCAPISYRRMYDNVIQELINVFQSKSVCSHLYNKYKKRKNPLKKISKKCVHYGGWYKPHLNDMGIDRDGHETRCVFFYYIHWNDGDTDEFYLAKIPSDKKRQMIERYGYPLTTYKKTTLEYRYGLNEPRYRDYNLYTDLDDKFMTYYPTNNHIGNQRKQKSKYRATDNFMIWSLTNNVSKNNLFNQFDANGIKIRKSWTIKRMVQELMKI